MLLLVGAGHSVGVGLGVPVVVVVVFVAVVLVVVGGGSGAVVVVWALWLSLLFFVQGFSGLPRSSLCQSHSPRPAIPGFNPHTLQRCKIRATGIRYASLRRLSSPSATVQSAIVGSHCSPPRQK